MNSKFSFKLRVTHLRNSCATKPASTTSTPHVRHHRRLIVTAMSKALFGVPNSGWASPKWNWGYAQGTGHDCAKICRQQYGSIPKRKDLVKTLMDGSCEQDFEEVKLVLALAWQSQRRYTDVLEKMAQAKRYEVGDEDECSTRLVQDMQERFTLLQPSEEDMNMMKTVTKELDANNVKLARQRCAGLVLNAMGFIERGL
jgi:hypothetical protein